MTMEQNNSILKKSILGNRATFTFKSKGEKADMHIISEAFGQAYRNKLEISFFQDDFNTISICFSGLPDNINKIEAFYNKP